MYSDLMVSSISYNGLNRQLCHSGQFGSASVKSVDQWVHEGHSDDLEFVGKCVR